MKWIMWMVGWGLVSSFAFAASDDLPSGGEIPAVTRVAISGDEVHGADRVTFEVETTGPCEVFTTEIDAGSGDEMYLTIVKKIAPNCTRPRHAPRVEAKTLALADELRGVVRLGNPILVESSLRK